ncbi:MAG: hypothetical protein HQL31_09625, partial [Planctomycetes bacterium]|nr:hypothetical protein [Planctomycetota bacterium]
MKKTMLLMALAIGLTLPIRAEIRLPQIFSDHMVLQREVPVKLWGWAPAGKEITVGFAGQKVSVKAGSEGKWRAELKALEADCAPQEMRITAPGEADIIFKDVLVGEVWFTAGQSNMVMGMAGTTGGVEFFDKHSPKAGGLIRTVYMMGPPVQSDTPKDTVPANWGAISQGYSAVGGYFAFKLFEHFGGKVPVGMVTYCAIVKAEAWVDEATLRGDPILAPVFDDVLKHATKLYNGTINAVAPYSMRGAIYYQAEYNGFGDNALRFRTLMPALIKTWRRSWEEPELPFLFVQLPGFITMKAPESDIDMDPVTLQQYRNLKGRGTWTEVRESQLLTWLSTPKTGMAVTIDLGEDYDIHPPRKEPIGDRLLLLARHYAYVEQDIVYSGP